jgi:hypothetical protein
MKNLKERKKESSKRVRLENGREWVQREERQTPTKPLQTEKANEKEKKKTQNKNARKKRSLPSSSPSIVLFVVLGSFSSLLRKPSPLLHAQGKLASFFFFFFNY